MPGLKITNHHWKYWLQTANFSLWLVLRIFLVTILLPFSHLRSSCRRAGEQGGKSPFSLLSEPISPSSLLFWANFALLPKRLRFFFSLLPTFSPYFSLLPTFFGPFLPPPYSVPPPSWRSHGRLNPTNLQKQQKEAKVTLKPGRFNRLEKKRHLFLVQ